VGYCTNKIITSSAVRENVVHCMNTFITSSAVRENVVHCMNTFITSSLAFGCHVGCHRRIFVVGLLFLSTAVHGIPVSPEDPSLDTFHRTYKVSEVMTPDLGILKPRFGWRETMGYRSAVSYRYCI